MGVGGATQGIIPGRSKILNAGSLGRIKSAGKGGGGTNGAAGKPTEFDRTIGIKLGFTDKKFKDRDGLAFKGVIKPAFLADGFGGVKLVLESGFGLGAGSGG